MILHSERFPKDFMFQLTKDEFAHLRSQIVTSSDWGGRRYPPYAFTEQGVAMLSSVLRSPRAIQVNIEIMRAFVRLRRMLASHEELARRLDRDQLNHGLQEVHRFSQDLRPSIIDDLGLSPALKSLVTISHSGQGFELPPRTDEFLVSGNPGLAGMGKRARLLGGTLHVQSTPGQGTTVTVEIPG